MPLLTKAFTKAHAPALLQIPLPNVEDKRRVQDDVDKDRKHAIEAAIVRIMKSRKALQHQQVRSPNNCVHSSQRRPAIALQRC